MKIPVKDARRMISKAGGLQEFAKLLDPNRRWESNTILWWKQRGIPASIQLEYYEHLQLLREQLLSR